MFWVDDDSQPEAAAITIAWGDDIALAPIVLPDVPSEWVAHVIERGLRHAADCGFDTVDLEVDVTDEVMRQILGSHGFVAARGPDESSASVPVVEAWLAATERPELSALTAGYRLCNRLDTAVRPHHMIERSGPDVEARLKQTSLYRPDFDLLILDDADNLAAQGLFWFDPATATGLVEPMRTQDDHQRRGLARHVLTAGLRLLADAGAERIKICFDKANDAASGLYLDVGFAPVKETVVFSGRAS